MEQIELSGVQQVENLEYCDVLTVNFPFPSCAPSCTDTKVGDADGLRVCPGQERFHLDITTYVTLLYF